MAGGGIRLGAGRHTPVHTRPPVAPGLAPPKTSLTAVKPPATVVTHDVAGTDFVGSPIQVKDVVGIDFVGAPLIIRDVSGVNFVGTERPLHLATPASAVAVKPH